MKCTWPKFCCANLELEILMQSINLTADINLARSIANRNHRQPPYTATCRWQQYQDSAARWQHLRDAAANALHADSGAVRLGHCQGRRGRGACSSTHRRSLPSSRRDGVGDPSPRTALLFGPAVLCYVRFRPGAAKGGL